MTESEERELQALVHAAFDAKGTPEFDERIRAIEERYSPAYELWLIRNQDYGGRSGASQCSP